MRIARTQSLEKGTQSPGRRESAHVRTLEKNREDLKRERADLKAQHDSLVQSQLDLEVSRDRYSELFDTVPVCFVTLSPAGIIREINLPGVRLLSLQREQVV